MLLVEKNTDADKSVVAKRTMGSDLKIEV